MDNNQATIISFTENGSILVEGSFQLRDKEGNVIASKNKEWLCRCGQSESKPFCDGSHKKVGFQGDLKPVVNP